MKRLLLAFFSVFLWNSELQAQASFYRGKTIRIVVGYLAGDTHDLWARVYSRHMGKHIPGNPDFIVQNMPGAGSVMATNYVYTVAKPDGSTSGGRRAGQKDRGTIKADPFISRCSLE